MRKNLKSPRATSSLTGKEKQRQALKKGIGPIIMPLIVKKNTAGMTQAMTTQTKGAPQPTVVVDNTAVAKLRPQLVMETNVRPTKFTVIIDSTPGAVVGNSTIAIFNNDKFAAATSDAAVTFSYSDGWVGKFMDVMLYQAGVEGVPCYGLNIECVDQNGAASNAGIAAMVSAMRYYTGFGPNYYPTSFDLNGLARKSDYKSGLETVKVKFPLSALAQFIYTQQKNRVMTITFFMDEDEFNEYWNSNN